MIRINKQEYHKLFNVDRLRLINRTVTPEKAPDGKFLYYAFYSVSWGFRSALLKRQIREGVTMYYADERFYNLRLSK